MEWFTSSVSFANLNSGAQTNLTLYNATVVGARFVKGATVTRMLVDIIVRSDSVAQDNRLFWGITIVNADARAAGAFPEAADFSDRPGWLGRGLINNKQSDLSDSSQWSREKLDLRSQRILRNEEDELQLILENGGSNILEFTAYVRTLMKHS